MTERLIELVRCEPCLYDTNHPDYSKKTLKELLWVKIAKESNYKDGTSAKDAWKKLRNCHRDAIRRRNQLSKSGSAAAVTKPWKFENQMEFLVTHMTNRPTTGNMTTGLNENLIQHEELIEEQETEEREHSNECSVPFLEFLPPDITGNSSTEDPITTQLLPSPISQTRIPPVAPPAVKSTAKKHNLNTLIANTLQNHENRAKERAEKRCHRDEGDELQHFFNTMYKK